MHEIETKNTELKQCYNNNTNKSKNLFSIEIQIVMTIFAVNIEIEDLKIHKSLMVVKKFANDRKWLLANFLLDISETVR
ncbi:hypothetical protein D1835_10455 [Enterococcus asini]|nr:hypothetical protein [Enterococcus asini]